MLLCMVALGLTVATNSSLAQSQSGGTTHLNDTTTHLLDEFVVSAVHIQAPPMLSKIPASPRELPITTNSLSRKLLQTMDITTLVDATRDIPGVAAHKSYGGFDLFYIRGIEEVIVLNDGMRDERNHLWQSAPITGMAAVDKIEVLKGASSMTVGHSALGGVINIVHKKPTYAFHANAEATYGSFGTVRTNLGAGGEVFKDFRVRADFGMVNSDGWRQNYTKGYNGRLSMAYKINKSHEVSLAVTANDDHYGGDYGQPTLGVDLYSVATGKLAYSKGWINPKFRPEVSYSDPLEIGRADRKSVV